MRDDVVTAAQHPAQQTWSWLRRGHRLDWLIAVAAAIGAVAIAEACRVRGLAGVDDAAKPIVAAVALFGLAGFPVVRLLLPERLRAHELLWILPIGACAVALSMTVLGFARVPYAANLSIVGAAAVLGSAITVRRHGLPQRPPSWRAILWPAYIALLLGSLALIPLFRPGYATVVGQGQDAVMAAGTAEFLKHASPGDVKPELPVDQEWDAWRSKQAIYYATAAVSTLTGMETYEVLSALATLMFALAAVGMFLIAREMLGTGIGLAALAMALAGLDRMVLHTAMHPYYNQIWGYMATPFGLVLAWQLVRSPSIPTAVLLALMLAIDFFAYPLAAPIVLAALALFWWGERRSVPVDLRAAAERLRRGPLYVKLGGLVLLALLAYPLYGVGEKLVTGLRVLLDPGYSLATWGGDVFDYFPEPWFFGIPDAAGWPLLIAAVLALAAWQLRRSPRGLAWGFAGIFAAGAVIVLSMRVRDGGYYFHFKMLAFLGPLVVVLAVAALGALLTRSRRWQVAALAGIAVWGALAIDQGYDEIADTYDELPPSMLQLRDWAAELPEDASIRLDIDPGLQNWPWYMLHERRVCSIRPLLKTAYPRVAYSIGADYALVQGRPRPKEAVGPAVRRNNAYALYRLQGGLIGGDQCSYRVR